ncbi:hypothetical protein [Rhizobium rhizogenes]|uniref:hypothetical protein n=1 Tax=Rhizobium rhizogenes TaxID=359 RepID=UPI00080FABCE|nr:hypothetical protein [Rhizobium rhizogenes]OCJ22343.1 hypothetical protein A6U88_29455 [Agrobacterium sp. B131/95]NTH46632.1 hypothetical protein [Rhizobium rhizogenes]NTH59498.1 hypothetical protein [Rhizobium rhizogenes]NTH90649.1 hypothetical protein [Rhizobium rhizogenes]NTI42825.1 hypothetical protein [Rhizobium rhizogenes]
MDFLSIILSAIGWKKDRVGKVSDRKIEVYRLNAEVAAECMRTTDMLTGVTPRIMRRFEMLFPDQSELYKGCAEALSNMRSDAVQLQTMAESYKTTIQQASSWVDWDSALMRFHEWRATAAQIYPHSETIVQRIEALLTQEEQEQGYDPVPVSQRDSDRGWDAPPL